MSHNVFFRTGVGIFDVVDLSFDAMSYAPNLRLFDFGQNHADDVPVIADIETLGRLTKLARLQLYGKISGDGLNRALSTLSELQHLWFLTPVPSVPTGQGRGDDKLHPMRPTRHPRSQFAEGLRNISNIAGCPHMRWLWLSDNPQLEDIRPIQKLTYIRQLLLDNTPIVDLAPLAELR